MTAAPVVAAGPRRWLAGRIGASAVVALCVVLYAVGLLAWARSPAAQEAALLSHLRGWSAAGLQEAVDELGVTVATASAYVMVLDLVAASIGVAAALLVLRQATSWFPIALGVVLTLWTTAGGTLVEIFRAAPTGPVLLVEILPALGWAGFIAIAYLFPDGRFVPRWTRWCVVALGLYFTMLLVLDVTGIASSVDSPVAVIPLFGFFATAAYAAVHRYRHTSSPRQRRQLRGVMAAIVLWVALVLARLPLAGWLETRGTGALVANAAYVGMSFGVVILLCLSIVVAIVRHNLYDVDPWVNRALVYGGLTALVAIVYALVAGIGALIWPGSGLAGPLAAAIVLAAVLHPLRLRLQRVVDRFVYGSSLEPRELLAELRESRERILAAREAERARLQRDLHDGLGPTLASLYQRVDAARALMNTDPAAADAMLEDVATQTKSVIGEIRTLVRALRPPELDELGLARAIEAAAGRLDDVEVRVVAGDLAGTPSVVEAAAYRIATEALTNVARHSGAASARVTLDHDGAELVLAVADDGRGMASATGAGTGLRSIRERAEELGGTVELEATSDGGTQLTAHLPCRTSRRSGRHD